jgi:hypothetical protein
MRLHAGVAPHRPAQRVERQLEGVSTAAVPVSSSDDPACSPPDLLFGIDERRWLPSDRLLRSEETRLVRARAPDGTSAWSLSTQSNEKARDRGARRIDLEQRAPFSDRMHLPGRRGGRCCPAARRAALSQRPRAPTAVVLHRPSTRAIDATCLSGRPEQVRPLAFPRPG